MELEQNICDLWNEMSYKRYNKKNRKYSYEPTVFDLEDERLEWMKSVCNDPTYPFDSLMEFLGQFGLYEDLTLRNCLGIEDIPVINKIYN